MITAEYIAKVVTQALAEDIASGDITAELIGADVQASGRIVTREDGILCGTAFALEAFQQIDPSCHVEWAAQDGDAIAADSLVCTLSGPARALLTGERTHSISCSYYRAPHRPRVSMLHASHTPGSSCWIPARPCPGSDSHRNTP